MATGTIKQIIPHHTDVPFSGHVIGAKTFADVNLGIAPLTQDYQVVAAALSWCFITNAWTTNGTITVTISNPYDFQVTTDAWNKLRIFWL